ncbi:hypothetical protein P175DRAFT_0557612 [Aspergillus ochraceoroseus IBT 24754]|uniref:SWIM-type domain-containing protein n=1 Tax=Aspergillus ochraceoroseus IBT 24754 TaxID=1392256 RepID=A0A2T5LXA7_9EURO|nr:uncharacterized protein P175DRAFT_0557612 [Aspergillus ochraceoroseus IBT 24754]PTU20925.1 hypothetical protein P175DRAFT_0557612 [Aspergillus ochraceoroseus IBT 24754]
MDPSPTTSPLEFVNSLIAQLAQYTSTSPPPEPTPELPRQNTPSQHPASAFPSSQLPRLKPLMITLHCLFPNEFLLALDILDRGLVSICAVDGGPSGPVYPGEQNEEEKEEEEEDVDIFFVSSASTGPGPPTSSSQVHSAFHRDGQQQQQQQQQQDAKKWRGKGYEVRLHAWNCTCALFTIAAFRDLGPQVDDDQLAAQEEEEGKEKEQSGAEIQGSVTTASSITGICSSDDENNNNNNNNSNCDDDENNKIYSFGGTLTAHATNPASTPPVCKHILACLLVALCPGLGPTNSTRAYRGGRFVSVSTEELGALCAGWGG